MTAIHVTLLPAEDRCEGVEVSLLELYYLTLIGAHPVPLSPELGRLPRVIHRDLVIGKRLAEMGQSRVWLTTAGRDRLDRACDSFEPAIDLEGLLLLAAAEVNQHLPLRWVSAWAHVVVEILARKGLLTVEHHRGEPIYYPTDLGSSRVRFAMGGG